MLIFAIAFLGGDLLLQSLPHLPSAMVIACAMGIGSILLASAPHWRLGYLFSALLLGFSWTAWIASATIEWTLPKKFEGRDIILRGYIASLPSSDQWQTSFLFAAKPALIRLSWRGQHKRIRVGDQWALPMRIKRVHGTQNPGAFDFEAYALQKGIRATGYVNVHARHQLLAHQWYRYPIDHLRQKYQDHILAVMPKSPTAPWLQALMLGERHAIPPSYWQVLRRTGTNHLMAIGGLHIGIVAGFIHIIVNYLWRRFPRLLLFMPAQIASGIAALIAAFIYSTLAGFSIPTQRACLMLGILMIVFFQRRLVCAWHVWGGALFVVLLCHPLNALSDSFWLSFGTIALIIYGMRGRLAATGWWWKWGRVQWVIGLGLMPVTLLLFHECSIVGVIANCIAIPWLSFLLLPLCMLGFLCLMISPTCSSFVFVMADKSLAILWNILTWLAHLDIATWEAAIPSFSIALFTIGGVMLLLMPSGMPGRWVGGIWVLPVFYVHSITPNIGDYWLTLLDVGQGLSVVVQTHAHTLVFDAGPKFAGGSIDLGASVVVPYLQSINTNKINTLVISHGDNDHIGGAEAIRAAFPVLSIKTSVPAMLPSPVTSICLRGDHWQWDGVSFEFLHPTTDEIDDDNDSSCVLRIHNQSTSSLIAGDIEKKAEKSMLLSVANMLPVNILIAPHHGSKTSGSIDFISATHPQVVLYAIGYRNRYHFPHPSVMQRYEKIGALQLNTADSGAIILKMTHNKTSLTPVRYRIAHRRYWFD